MLLCPPPRSVATSFVYDKCSEDYQYDNGDEPDWIHRSSMFWDMKYPMTIARTAITRRRMITVSTIVQIYNINLTLPNMGGKNK